MASCVPFTSCFTGWFTKFNRNGRTRPIHAVPIRTRLRERECSSCGQKRMNAQQPTFRKPNKEGALRKILAGKRNARQKEVGPLPEPCTVAQLPPGVLKYWAPQSRCCEDVMEEIRLNSSNVDSGCQEATTPASATDREENKRLDLSTRFRNLFGKQKTPEQLEMKALRKEQKAVVKYLKRVGLYNHRMSYEHMKKLKTVVEDSLESERQKEEIELKELQHAKDSTKLESNSQSADTIQQPEAPPDNKSNPEPNAPKVEAVAIPPPKSEQLVLPRPEGPLKATDGTVIHPGTGLPVSAAIDVPGAIKWQFAEFQMPSPCVPIVNNNTLCHATPGDVPCIQCNPKVIVVHTEIHPEPKMDEEMAPAEDSKTVAMPADMVNGADPPPPLPAKSKPHIVGFMLKPGVTLEDLDAIEVDPNYDPKEEERQNRTRAKHAPLCCDLTPKPLQNLRWTFGDP